MVRTKRIKKDAKESLSSELVIGRPGAWKEYLGNMHCLA